MRREPSALALKRARRYAAGESRVTIARDEGVGQPRILEAIRRVVMDAGDRLPPGSPLPACAFWRDREPKYGPIWYVSVVGIPSPDDVRWALSVLARRVTRPVGHRKAPPIVRRARALAR
jgi:hypothetical protein